MSDADGYAGPATLTVDGRAVPVHAVLDARHEPQDGRLHWFGRLRTTDPRCARLDELAAGARYTVSPPSRHGESAVRHGGLPSRHGESAFSALRTGGLAR